MDLQVFAFGGLTGTLWLGFGLRRVYADGGEKDVAGASTHGKPVNVNMMTACAVAFNSRHADFKPTEGGSTLTFLCKCGVCIRSFLNHATTALAWSKLQGKMLI